MNKNTWYLVGLVLVAAACGPILEPMPDLSSGANFAPDSRDTTSTGGVRREGDHKHRLF